MNEVFLKEKNKTDTGTAQDLKIGEYAIITGHMNTGHIILRAYGCVVSLTEPTKVWDDRIAHMIKIKKIMAAEIVIVVNQ